MTTMSNIRGRSPMWRDLPIDLISRSPIARWAPVPLRLIVGYGFMEHGFAKLARGPDAFPVILQALGVPAPHLMGWLTILVEIFGGLAVLLGALVPLASKPMAAVLLVAIITVHLPYGFSSIKLRAVGDRQPSGQAQKNHAAFDPNRRGRRLNGAISAADAQPPDRRQSQRW